jgi:hypothetical protein
LLGDRGGGADQIMLHCLSPDVQCLWRTGRSHAISSGENKIMPDQ